MSPASQNPTNNTMPATVPESSRGRRSVGLVDGDSYYPPVVHGRSASVPARPIADDDLYPGVVVVPGCSNAALAGLIFDDSCYHPTGWGRGGSVVVARSIADDDLCPTVVPGRDISALVDHIDGDSYYPPVDSAHKGSALAGLGSGTSVPVITPDHCASPPRIITTSPTATFDSHTRTPSAFETTSSTDAEDSASTPETPPSPSSRHVEHGCHNNRIGCRAGMKATTAEIENTNPATWPISYVHITNGSTPLYTPCIPASSPGSAAVTGFETTQVFQTGWYGRQIGATPHNIHLYIVKDEKQREQRSPLQWNGNPYLFSNVENLLRGSPGPSWHRPPPGFESLWEDRDIRMHLPQGFIDEILPELAPYASFARYT